MRKFMLAALAVVAAASIVPASAKTISSKTLTFKAQVPCAAVCTYWLPHQESPGTFAVLPWVAGTTNPVDGSALPVIERDEDKAYAKQSSYACTQPSPEGSYDDYVVTAPRGSYRMKITYTPTVDWDVYICNKPKSGNNGSLVASETVPYLEECPASCESYVAATVKPGRRYVIRAYNWSDPSDLIARLKFTS